MSKRDVLCYSDTFQKSDFENLKRRLAQTCDLVLMPEKMRFATRADAAITDGAYSCIYAKLKAV
jgi:hypothetical protein